jgi:hypothetical protein
MKKNSIKYFWFILVLSALFINENLVYWALAVIVGDYNLTDGFNKTFKYFTFSGYAIITAIRLIPYLILGVVVIILKAKQKRATSGIAWGGLAGIVFMIVYESWNVQHGFFTGEHVSSTAGLAFLAFLVIPFFAVASGIIGALIGWGVSYIIFELTKALPVEDTKEIV